jgi:hypothetical protein
MSLIRWWTKASCLASGWKVTFNEEPNLATVALALSVAELETQCGDAWPGEHNWGGVQLGPLTGSVATMLAKLGVPPAPANLDRARSLIKQYNCQINGALHVDSTPTPEGQRYYWAVFYTSPTDEGGAREFVHALAADKPSVRAALTKKGASPRDVAQAMYDAHYFEGFHNPKQPGGAEANVDDYAGGIARHLPIIEDALDSAGGWQPGLSPSIDLSTTLGVQEALNVLSYVVNGLSPVAEDGVDGKQTKEYVSIFQEKHGLTVDGIAGPETVAELHVALGMALASKTG